MPKTISDTAVSVAIANIVLSAVEMLQKHKAADAEELLVRLNTHRHPMMREAYTLVMGKLERDVPEKNPLENLKTMELRSNFDGKLVYKRYYVAHYVSQDDITLVTLGAVGATGTSTAYVVESSGHVTNAQLFTISASQRLQFAKEGRLELSRELGRYLMQVP